MNTPCKNCPARHPICHDSCPKYAEYKRQRGAEAAYTREMLDTGKVYHYDHEDRHRERGPPPGAGTQEVHGSERRSGQMKEEQA